MPKRSLFVLLAVLVLVFVPCFAHAQQPPTFAQLQARAAKAPHPPLKLQPMQLVGGNFDKSVPIPVWPPYANFYRHTDPTTEVVSSVLQVGNVSFVPASAPEVLLNDHSYGFLPRRNGFQPNGGKGVVSDYSLNTVVTTGLPFGTTKMAVRIPFTQDADYRFSASLSRPYSDSDDACQVPDANGNPTDSVAVFTRMRGWTVGSPLPQATYQVKIGGLATTLSSSYSGTLPSPVWLYGQVGIADYYSHFVGGTGGSHSLSVQIQALGNTWITFESWYPSNLVLCQKG